MARFWNMILFRNMVVHIEYTLEHRGLVPELYGSHLEYNFVSEDDSSRLKCVPEHRGLVPELYGSFLEYVFVPEHDSSNMKYVPEHRGLVPEQ